MKNKKVKEILAIIILLISIVLIIGSLYYSENFGEQSFEVLLYNFKFGVEKANVEVVGKAIKESLWKICILSIILFLPVINYKNKYIIDIKYKNKEKSLKVFPFNKMVYVLTVFIISIGFCLQTIGIFQYLRAQTEKSKFFEEEYIATQSVKIVFPEEKRNLIFIFLESMENSLMSQEEGGGWEYNVIPELTKLAEENTNFSNTSELGGAMYISGTNWTAAGMVAQTCGIPLKIDINEKSNYSNSPFLPGAYTLGDILQKEGYNLEVMFGSDASFGARDAYFKSHGNYKIFDVNTAIEQGKMTEEDKVWWGFSDDDLFEWSKEEILNLAKEDKPFNYIMLTADTHFVDGYLSENAEEVFDTQYENVFRYSSKITNEFIDWIKMQDFYENTTIVLVGDHLGMQSEFYKENIVDNNYLRTIYNTFINSVITEENSKNRQFTSFDIFPTVIASIGGTIEGDRLGLGTNLYSNKQTIIEEVGYKVVDDELLKQSDYYNKTLLQDSYLVMLKKAHEK